MAQSDLERRIARTLGGCSAWVIGLPAKAVVQGVLQLPKGSTVVEALGGTPVACTDIKLLGNDAHSRDALLVVDISLPGILACAANRLGAHLAYSSLTDEVCVVCCSSDLQQSEPKMMERLHEAASANPYDTQAASELLEEHDNWWHTSSDAAQVVASYMRCHPRVSELRYPGLKTDPSFAVAARTLGRGFGPFVDYRLDGKDTWNRIVCGTEDVRLQIMHLELALA